MPIASPKLAPTCDGGNQGAVEGFMQGLTHRDERCPIPSIESTGFAAPMQDDLWAPRKRSSPWPRPSSLGLSIAVVLIFVTMIGGARRATFSDTFAYPIESTERERNRQCDSLALLSLFPPRSRRPALTQTFPRRRQPVRRNGRAWARPTHGALAFLSDGKMLVTELPARCASSRATEGFAAGLPACRRSVPPARADCTTSCSIVTSRRNRTIYFCYRRAGLGRRPHRDGARPLHRRRRAARARRREGDLPPGRPALERQSLWLPHRAGPRRQSVAHDGRPLHLPRRRPESRQPHRQDRARDAGRRGAARQSVRRPQRTPGRRSGATAIATARAPRCIRRPASCGSTSMVRAAATRSISRSPGRITAGR